MSNKLLNQKLIASVDEKRAGHYTASLLLCHEAHEIDPLNLDVYGQFATVFAGLFNADASLRSILTRQYLGQLYPPCTDVQLMSAISYYDWPLAKYHNFKLGLNYVLDIINSKSRDSRMFRYILNDYSYTRMAGLLFISRSENQNILKILNITIDQVEKVLRGYLEDKMHIYDSSIDPAIALIGLNLIATNRIKLEHDEKADSMKILEHYSNPSVELLWRLS